MRADVLEILLLVGGVDAQEIVVVRHFVYQDVVHEAAVLVKQAGIMRLADLELARRALVVTKSASSPRFRPADFDLAHVADIEKAHGCAHGLVLVDDAGILHGHVPAAEIHHLGAQRAMDGIQRSFQQRGFGHEESGYQHRPRGSNFTWRVWPARLSSAPTTHRALSRRRRALPRCWWGLRRRA